MPTTRRSMLGMSAGGVVLAGSGLARALAAATLPQGSVDSQRLEALPGKRPLLKRSYRPPNYETPLAGFENVLTPNDRFFVRWHLADIPRIDRADWRLRIEGSAANPLELSFEQLQRDFEPAELVAVCQCAGNRRGLSEPHVPGVEWGSGAMGNARWKGARLKDILARVGLGSDAVEVAFNGADSPVLEATPAFVKSLPVWKAIDEHTLVAYEMNGAPLPHWNGFPARLVVPGWTSTYWMKQIRRIRVLAQPLDSFWMNTAYRIPKGKFPGVDPFASQESASSMPITSMLVNSLITNPANGQRVRSGHPVTVKGCAWDGGTGVQRVEVSLDGGRSWQTADLGVDLGRYSFRPWTFRFTPRTRGVLTVMVRASDAAGATQPFELVFNPAGYHNNVVQKVEVRIT